MKRMLNAPEIYLYRESVDFRKSLNGLAAIIESDTDLPLGSGALFLFTNKQRDKIKVLYWDKQALLSGINASKKPSTNGLQKSKTKCLS
ncbi:IS66 family insertion sequence element accessory protein TnpB [Vibrio sp. M260112]